MKYTKEILEAAASKSTSMAGVMRELGLQPTGGSHCHLRRRLNHFGIDTSHFTRVGIGKGTPSSRRQSAREILVMRPDGSNRQKPRVLRRALAESGVPFRCANCGLGDSWQGKPLILHVDHRNGNYLDCRLENLRYLCPNCHTQTDNFAGKSRGKTTRHHGDPAATCTSTPEPTVAVESTADAAQGS